MNLSAIDLNLLVVLHTVLERGSVAAAAAELHVTPPAVSNALARLRDALGDPLLVRRGRGLVATPRAQRLAPRLAAALRELGRAVEQDAAFDPSTTTRRFVIACSDADQICSVPLIAAAFARTLPHARLQVVSIDQLTATDGLASGTVDAAFAPPGAVDPRMHTRDLYADEAVMVLRADHPVRARRLSAHQFNGLDHVDVWLVLGEAGEGNRQAEVFLAQHGLHRNIALVVPGFAAAAMVAAKTDLVAAMPRRVAEALSRSFSLRLARLPTPPMRMTTQLVWHPRTHEDAGASFLRECIADAVPK